MYRAVLTFPPSKMLSSFHHHLDDTSAMVSGSIMIIIISHLLTVIITALAGFTEAGISCFATWRKFLSGRYYGW